MSDMLDVLHYFFEEDALWSTTAEHSEAKDAIRSQVYETLYKTTYNYSSSKSRTQNFDNIDSPLDELDMPQPVDPFARSNSVKPYTPATDFDHSLHKPFGDVLDAPLR
jgi:hypothetical protein